MAAKLILSMSGVVLQEYPLSKERMTIGRKDHNDIVIENLAVSGEHAAIVTVHNDSFMEDLDSTNGVAVNGTATKKHLLLNNDLIEIGKYKLKYINDQPGSSTAADFEKTMILNSPLKMPVGRPVKTSAGEETGKYQTVATPQSSKIEKTIAPHQAKPAAPAQPIKIPTPASIPPVSSQPAPLSSPQTTPLVSSQPTHAPSQQSGGVIQVLTGPNAGKELELVKNLTTLGKPGLQVAVLTKRPQGYFITYVEGATYPTVNGRLLDDQPHQLVENDIIELAGIKMEFYLK